MQQLYCTVVALQRGCIRWRRVDDFGAPYIFWSRRRFLHIDTIVPDEQCYSNHRKGSPPFVALNIIL